MVRKPAACRIDQQQLALLDDEAVVLAVEHVPVGAELLAVEFVFEHHLAGARRGRRFFHSDNNRRFRGLGLRLLGDHLLYFGKCRAQRISVGGIEVAPAGFLDDALQRAALVGLQREADDVNLDVDAERAEAVGSGARVATAFLDPVSDENDRVRVALERFHRLSRTVECGGDRRLADGV